MSSNISASRIRFQNSGLRIRGSGSERDSYGSTTLVNSAPSYNVVKKGMNMTDENPILHKTRHAESRLHHNV
jgi:hypothetical protein